MAKPKSSHQTTAHDKLLAAGIERFRRDGYGATTVDEICTAADVTKGAFFHHFASKQALAQACLARWSQMGESLAATAPFQTVADPVQRLLGYMDFYIGVFADPKLFKSCLAGVAAQEVSQSHPALRQAANDCLMRGQRQFEELLKEACRRRRRRLDTESLAALWMAALQGSLVLSKASQDEAVVSQTLTHVRQYIRSLLAART